MPIETGCKFRDLLIKAGENKKIKTIIHQVKIDWKIDSEKFMDMKLPAYLEIIKNKG